MPKTIYNNAILQVQLILLIFTAGAGSSAAASVVVNPGQCSTALLRLMSFESISNYVEFSIQNLDAIDYYVNSRDTSQLSIWVGENPAGSTYYPDFSAGVEIGTSYVNGCATLTSGFFSTCRPLITIRVTCNNALYDCPTDIYVSASQRRGGPCSSSSTRVGSVVTAAPSRATTTRARNTITLPFTLPRTTTTAPPSSLETAADRIPPGPLAGIIVGSLGGAGCIAGAIWRGLKSCCGSDEVAADTEEAVTQTPVVPVGPWVEADNA